MSERIIKKRVFLLRDDEGRNMDVVAKLHSLGGQTPYFSITSQHGSDHERMLKNAPADVRDDIQTLVNAHLSDQAGVPMHAVANATYQLENAKFKEALGSLGNVVPISEIYELHQKLVDCLEYPETLNSYLAMVKTAAQEADRQIRAQQRFMENISAANTHNPVATKKITDAIKVVYGLIGGQEKDIHSQKEEYARIGEYAHGKFSTELRKKLGAGRVRKIVFADGVAAFAADKCFPLWKQNAAAAMAALDKPDYRLQNRPEIGQDPTTFEGFIAKWGLAMKVETASKSAWGAKYAWNCTITGPETPNLHGRGELLINFGKNVNEPPTLLQVLENLQSDFSSVIDRAQDEFIEELGFAEDMKSVRRGEQAYQTIAHDYTVKFKEITGGEACYQELLTSVGDNPPLGKDYFETPSATPAP